MNCRVFPYEQSDGPDNMALDEALLDSAARAPESASFRTYGWSVPTLSLGYFQSLSAAESDARWRDVPIVRRPTGGGAIWHDREITYALVVPKVHPLARRTADLYKAVHGAVSSALASLGIVGSRRGSGQADAAGPARDPAGLDRPLGEMQAPKKRDASCARADESARFSRSRPFLCFTDRDPEDILVSDMKVLGSAQRRRNGAVLQHGSLLLEQSSRVPELPGLRELAAVELDRAGWSALLGLHIIEALSLRGRTATVTPSERGQAATLAAEVYRNRAWTGRR
jgi:lipoate-protein ligase A